MSNIAIRVENLSKLYKIGARRDRHDTLRDHIMHGVKSLFSRNGTQPSALDPQPSDHIWALKDVSFEVKHGEVVGFIGKNGAGKSTLLKILSRITEPTTGRAEIFGRVGSLLEVGTGFHPELTGRENIYLNGAILGMKRWEIEKKFDEIVAFSEIEKFIDTPVKRYSSGMYVRLAFAVAAHLDPEILIVDEVLAVGDMQFQTKCLGKINDVAKGGRTVLLVSHNLSSLRRLCNRGLLLNQGQSVCYGSVDDCAARYTQMITSGEIKMTSAPHVIYEAQNARNTPKFQLNRVEFLDSQGNPKDTVSTWDSLIIRLQYQSNTRVVGKGSLVIVFSTPDGTPLLHLCNQPDSGIPMDIKIGGNEVDCCINRLPLSAGEYLLSVGAGIPYQEWFLEPKVLARVHIYPNDVFGSGLSPTSTRGWIAIPHEWRVK
jgi:lipopolysaccharide transport system ATP-binding protein